MTTKDKVEVKTKEYLEGLIVIGKRIEEAEKQGKKEQVNQWFQYLQGYIKALDKITNH
jgi:hypothetical protein